MSNLETVLMTNPEGKKIRINAHHADRYLANGYNLATEGQPAETDDPVMEIEAEPEEETLQEPDETSGDEPAPIPKAKTVGDLDKMTKGDLYTYAKERYGVEIASDRDTFKEKMIERILELESAIGG